MQVHQSPNFLFWCIWISNMSCASASWCFMLSLACSKSIDCCQLWKPAKAIGARSFNDCPMRLLESSMSLPPWHSLSSGDSVFTMPSLLLKCSAILLSVSIVLPTYFQSDACPFSTTTFAFSNFVYPWPYYYYCLPAAAWTWVYHKGKSSMEESGIPLDTFPCRPNQGEHNRLYHLHHFS